MGRGSLGRVLLLQVLSHLVPLLLQESYHLVPLLLQESSLHFYLFFVKTFLVYYTISLLHCNVLVCKQLSIQGFFTSFNDYPES